MNENICAISTALGVGAISIVRCSGPDVISIVNNIFKGKDLNKVDSHTITYGHIIDNNEVIDEVLVTVMRAPKTFTKEDVVEINSHGGISTTNKVLELLIEHGCRLADPGEFSKKAFLNGRIDLVEAQGINDLILSESEEARRYAMNRVEGNMSKLINRDRKELIKLQSELEVEFDYPDEVDSPEMTNDRLLDSLDMIKDHLEELLKNSKEGSILKSGIDVAIIGKPNVGKSSILNHLLNENKAIVTNIAGTTRDIVEGSITLGGVKVNLIDTAGIRNTSDVVEKIGVDKSKEVLNKCNLAIFVLDNSTNLTEEEINIINSTNNVEKIVFINKIDLDSKLDISKLDCKNIIKGTTLKEDGLSDLKNKIIELFNLNKINGNNYNFLSSANDIALVKKSLDSIISAIDDVNSMIPYEMVAVDIKDAYDYLGEIIGSTYKEDVIDEMFKNFCVGK
ncbi:MAG TPA: tRNA uridine-5-carboxymethylaminomethyl(34) synthesis GTPase MnmE [Bacilli bacterium]|nr:tRNA uridine-5-carboxymethylaminomethyl(34) synthesis GTPase MnmE [Bacilli bacterium]